MLDIPEAAIHTITVPGINLPWKEMQPHGKKQYFSRGTCIYPYEKGDASFYYIAEGNVTILHGTADGHTRNMLFMQSGTLINVAHALGSSITSFLDANCCFYCVSNVELWEFPAGLLRDEAFVRENPRLIINLMESLGFKLLLMHNALSYAGTGNGLVRLSRFCLGMSNAHDGSLRLSPGLSLTELANMLGIHRISLFRALRKLKEMGVVSELSRHSLVIDDLEALKKLARG